MSKPTTEKKRKILICGNPDLNYIDGSSIWAQTIALVFANIPNTQIDFIAKTTPTRFELYSDLEKQQNIQIIDGTNPEYWHGKSHERLTLPMMGDLAIKLQHENEYDHIVVRGFDIATHLIRDLSVLSRCWMYLTDIPQKVDELSSDQKLMMSTIASHCSTLLCQTKGFAELWEKATHKLNKNKVFIYSPVIPDFEDNLTKIEQRNPIALYAGKFKDDWNTLEMAAAWPSVKQKVPDADAELVMIGDKIHYEPTLPTYEQQMRDALENTPGLTWLGALPRNDVQKHLKGARVGLSWRAESMNDTVEYSTKILEYGGAGCAAILNRNALHESLLGEDYPLYANSEQEFSAQLTKALSEPKLAQLAADRLTHLAKQHTFSQRVIDMQDWLNVVETQRPKQTDLKKKKVLVAGHDLKFFTLLQNKLEKTGLFEFKTDQWQGHNKHDEQKSKEHLEWADVIFCEWCLGNIKWYSHNKKPHQRLVGRFHLQEREQTFLKDANWDAIDHIAYVSEFIKREGQKAFGFPDEKVSVIPNLLDEEKFKPLKKTGDAEFTLGIIGVTPARKRLDRAIDLLEKLLEQDSRYCLRVKGKSPLDYGWLLKREDEIGYYKDIFERINSNPKLRHKVIFDPPGDDVNQWFRMVGYVLSPSDFESFHMAVGEGVFTHTTPVVWNWDGAQEIWGEENTYNDISDIVTFLSTDRKFKYDVKQQSKILAARYGSEAVSKSWAQHILGSS